MFPQFGSTAESLSKASTLVFRIGTDAHLYDDPDDVSIAPLLDSRFDSEKIEALKRLLALIAQGADVSNYFPQVVKNVASQSLEVKKLVYLYLLHYAEKRPNEALLSINCFQKDLSDTNPLVRAWALRTMAGIRLHATGPIVLAAVSKCARDPSAYVRKCAANALPKLHDLHQEENLPLLEELIYLLLSDNSPGVIGAAAAAFSSVCPQKLSLIGRNFRRLCETLPDVEEWGQIILTDVLLRYVVARHGLVQESVMFLPQNSDVSQNNLGFGFSHLISNDSVIMDNKESSRKIGTVMLEGYIEGPEKFLSFSSHLNRNDAEWDDGILTTCQNNDVKLLLQCTSPLLWSQNSAVVLAAAGVHWIMASREDVKKIVKPVLFILRSSYAARYVALCNIQVFVKAMPSLFAPYYEDFFISPSDSYQIRALKLEILSNIATDSSIPSILQEIQDYIKDPDRRFAADSVAAIGLCAQRIPSVAETCIQGLLALIKECSFNDHTALETEAGILVQSIVSIKAIISQNPAKFEKIVVQLAYILDSITVPLARALIIWIVGEYSSIGQNISRITPIILKYLAQSFTSEELETKQQILNTASKVALSAQGEGASIFRRILSYLLQLAKSDINYDVRDRARMVEKLLAFLTYQEEETSSSTSSKKELSQNIVDYIFSGKMQPTFPSSASRVYLPGSLSQVVLHAAPGYEPLPKPCSLLDSDMNICPDAIQQTNIEEDKTSGSYTGSDYSDTLSGSSAEVSDGKSRNSISQDDHDRADFVGDSFDICISKNHSENSIKSNQLIRLSDAGGDYMKTNENASDNTSPSFSSELAEFMSKTALESWLEAAPSSSGENQVRQASLRISLKEIAVNVRPKVYKLLDSVNGNGLRVDYSFSSDISIISPLLILIELLFENTSTESLRNITIIDVDDNEDTVNQALQTQESQTSVSDIPKIVPMEEIASLDPNEKVKKIMQVRFHHHLLPLKLLVMCGQKKFPVKLQPNIGYFIKPLSLDTEEFLNKELQLQGMFQYTRRCIFKDHISNIDHEDQSHDNDDKIISICQSLATTVLSGANLFFVSAEMPVSAPLGDISGLCLRFSCEILGNSKPCLLTIIAEGRSTDPLNILVKINCEETVFGLNLLNRVVALFTS